MNVLTWVQALESLSLGDRDMLGRIHGVESDLLEANMVGAGIWQIALERQNLHTQALVQRIRRAGGSMPATFVEAIAGPLRTNLDALSARSFLSIYETLSPLENAFIVGLLWPVRSRSGPLEWCVLAEVERDLAPVPPLIDALPTVASIPYSAFDLDEVLLGFASIVRGGGVTLARASRLPQRVLQSAAARGAAPEVMQWLLAVCLAGHAVVIGPHGLEVGPNMDEWLRLSPALRRQELLRAWLVAAWDEWHSSASPRAKGIDMRMARRSIAYALLPHLPEQWHSLDRCIDTIRMRWPDIVRPVTTQRRWIKPAGWPTHWDSEDGAVIQLNLRGPLYWLGCVEWDQEMQYLRRTQFGSWISGLVNAEASNVREFVIFEDDYSLLLRNHADLWARYQLDWIGEARDVMTWQLGPRVVQRAVAAGMSLEQLMELLADLTGKAVSRAVRQDLALWAGSVAVTAVSTQCMVRTQSAAALDDILHDRRVGLKDGQRLNETTYVVPPDAQERVVRALRNAGYAVHAHDEERPVFRDAELRLIEQAVRAHSANEAARAVLRKITLLRNLDHRNG
jgi:hypothetical protein